MGKKGTYTKIKDAGGLTPKEKTAILHYISADGNIRTKELAAIQAADYQFAGPNAEQNARGEMRRILKKPESKAYINEVMKDRENQIVYDKLWIMENMKQLFHDAKSDQVKKGLLDSMAKTVGLFEDNVNITSSDKDPAKIAKGNFDKQMQARMLEFRKGKEDAKSA